MLTWSLLVCIAHPQDRSCLPWLLMAARKNYVHSGEWDLSSMHRAQHVSNPRLIYSARELTTKHAPPRNISLLPSARKNIQTRRSGFPRPRHQRLTKWARGRMNEHPGADSPPKAKVGCSSCEEASEADQPMQMVAN